MNDELPSPTGIWVAYYSDRSGIVAFPTEIEALRYAVKHSCEAGFRSYGVDLFVEEKRPA